jgi:hypothetical protein
LDLIGGRDMLDPQKNHVKSSQSRPEKTQSPRF